MNPKKPTPQPAHNLECFAAYNSQTHEPFVALHLDGKLLLYMHVTEATEFARNMIEAAGMSISDSFLWDFSISELPGGEETAIKLIDAFRAWRIKTQIDEERRKKATGKSKGVH